MKKVIDSIINVADNDGRAGWCGILKGVENIFLVTFLVGIL